MPLISLVLTTLLLGQATPARNPSGYLRLPAELRTILSKPAKVVLYKIDPDRMGSTLAAPSPRPVPTLSGYTILKQVPLTAAKRRDSIVKALYQSMEGNGLMMNCFEPHHALRVQGRGHTYDLILCFQCGSMEVWRDGKQLDSHGLNRHVPPIFAALTK